MTGSTITTLARVYTTAPGRAQRSLRCWALAGIAAMLSGCASLPADMGRGDIDNDLVARGIGAGASGEAAALVDQLVASPLSLDDTIRIALLNSPALQSEYASLGLGMAEWYSASRLSNPALSAAWMDPKFDGNVQRTYGLALSLADLITLPTRQRLSRQAHAALKRRVGDAALNTAADAAAAYYAYAGAEQVTALRARTADVATLAAQLAERFEAAGNLDTGHVAAASTAAAQLRIDALDAETAAAEARAELANMLGLRSSAAWEIEKGLRLPDGELPGVYDLQRRARESRLDLAAARLETEVLAGQRRAVGWMRWLGDVTVGYEREKDPDGSLIRGPTLELELPLFNQHRDDLLVADAEWQMAQAELRAVELAIDNSVTLAHQNLDRAGRRVAIHRDEMLPQYDELVNHVQQEYNFMLVGVFELIERKQQSYMAYESYIDSLRDYWLAHAALSRAVGNELPGTDGGQLVDVDELFGGGAVQDEHQHHHQPDPASAPPAAEEPPSQHRHHHQPGPAATPRSAPPAAEEPPSEHHHHDHDGAQQ